MFEKLRAWKERLQEQKIQGLKKGLRIVDKHLKADMSAKQLTLTIGMAHAEIHDLYLSGEITWAEREAAVDVLFNHYEKMWNMATFREKMA